MWPCKNPANNRFRMFPSGFDGKGTYIYAIGFRDGTTKIGVTGRPRTRLGEYNSPQADRIAWAHIFGAPRPKQAALHIERLACDLAAKGGTRLTAELFRDLPRSAVLDCVRKAAHLMSLRTSNAASSRAVLFTRSITAETA